MFTYDLGTVIGKIRMRLGDNVEGEGVLPSGINFSDEELEFVYGDSSSDFGYTLYKLSKIAATKWISSPKAWTADGLRINRGDPVQKWNQMADAFKEEFLIDLKYNNVGMFSFDLIREEVTT